MFRGASRRPLHILLLLLLIHPIFAHDLPSDPHFRAGLAYERLGRYDEAYTELQVAFALDQDRSSVALALALVACRLGRLDVAQRALERSISLDSNSVASYFELGLLYEKKNMEVRALDAWHRFLTLSQDDQLKALARRHIQYLEARHP